MTKPANTVTYYATANPRAPLVKVIGQWPSPAGLIRSCQSGVRILSRPATPAETQQEAESLRHLAVRWTDLEAMLKEEAEDQGEQAGELLREAVRLNRPLIDAALTEGRKREARHERLKAKRRGDPPAVAPPPGPEPTDQDRDNHRRRQEIADKQNAEYQEAYLLALGVLGGGWTPWMVLRLIDSDYHRTGNYEPVATAYKVYRGGQRLTENSVYLRKLDDGTVKRSTRHEDLFGDLLTEPHPTRKLELMGGQVVPAPHYSLVWGALEKYEPRSAEQLAAARGVRERNKAAKEQVAFERDYPLWAEIERQEEEGRGR